MRLLPPAAYLTMVLACLALLYVNAAALLQKHGSISAATHLQSCQQFMVLQCSTAIIIYQQEPLLDHTLHRQAHKPCQLPASCQSTVCKFSLKKRTVSCWNLCPGTAAEQHSYCKCCTVQKHAHYAVGRSAAAHQHYRGKLGRWQDLSMLLAPLPVHCIAQ